MEMWSIPTTFDVGMASSSSFCCWLDNWRRLPKLPPMRLSVLDQSVAVAGRPHDQSIRNTVALARHCETLGYERFWVSEHHNHPTIVGTAPEIVMAAIAATTDRIRIGSA